MKILYPVGESRMYMMYIFIDLKAAYLNLVLRLCIDPTLRLMLMCRDFFVLYLIGVTELHKHYTLKTEKQYEFQESIMFSFLSVLNFEAVRRN